MLRDTRWTSLNTDQILHMTLFQNARQSDFLAPNPMFFSAHNPFEIVPDRYNECPGQDEQKGRKRDKFTQTSRFRAFCL